MDQIKNEMSFRVNQKEETICAWRNKIENESKKKTMIDAKTCQNGKQKVEKAAKKHI